MGPVHHKLSLLLFPPHPPPEWGPSMGSQVTSVKLLQLRLISPLIHRSCQGFLLSSVLRFLFCFFCSVFFHSSQKEMEIGGSGCVHKEEYVKYLPSARTFYMQRVCRIDLFSWVCLSTVYHRILDMGLGIDLASEVRSFFCGPSVSLKTPVSESRGTKPWSLQSQGIWGTSCFFE